MTDRFRILLNRISAQLNEKDIRSLALMCKIPESQRAGMKDGISLFDNLIKRDIINENKLDSLKIMLKNLSPKRRDLIREIENFGNGTQDDKSSTLTSIVSVQSSITPSVSRSDVVSTCCTFQCSCMMASCHNYNCKIPWSYVLAAAFFLTCFLFIALFWYADVPKVSEAIASDEHVRKSGPFILCAIIVLFLACLLSICFIKKRQNRRQNQNAPSARNQNSAGMQEVRKENVTEGRDAKRVGKSKTKNMGIPNVGFSRYDGHNEVLDSGTEDIDTDQDNVSRDLN